MQESYDEGVTDEFIKPIVNANCDGTIKEGDVVIFFNYRNDRAKEDVYKRQTLQFLRKDTVVSP